jgi:hypothetical protein
MVRSDATQEGLGKVALGVLLILINIIVIILAAASTLMNSNNNQVSIHSSSDGG